MALKSEEQVRQYKHMLELMMVCGMSSDNIMTNIMAMALKTEYKAIKWMLGEFPDPPNISRISEMEEQLTSQKVDFEKEKRELGLC